MTNATTMSLLVPIAEIAGVYVGFGVLIGAVRQSVADDPARQPLAQVVATTGLVTLLAALCPSVIASYAYPPHQVWFYSSVVYLAIIYIAFYVAFSQSEIRKYNLIDIKRFPVYGFVYWILMELPLQCLLFLNIFGVFSEKADAFYLTAVVLNLFEAGFFLMLFLFYHEHELE